MKVKEFISRLEELGYGDDTELRVFIHKDGNSFLCPIESISDGNRQYGYGDMVDVDVITKSIIFGEPKELKQHLEKELKAAVRKAFDDFGKE